MVPRAQTLDAADAMDEIRRQIGVHYDADDAEHRTGG